MITAAKDDDPRVATKGAWGGGEREEKEEEEDYFNRSHFSKATIFFLSNFNSLGRDLLID